MALRVHLNKGADAYPSVSLKMMLVWTILLFGLGCGNGQLVQTKVDPVLIVAQNKNLGGDPDVNLPPSIDDKKTVAGTVQGVVKLDGTYEEGLGSVIRTNRTSAFLNCTSGAMNVDVEFSEPFWGRIYADFNRFSACSVNGNGGRSYTLALPLRGCGTIQDPARVFINNIIVRFHAGLELDGDEVKTIICRYPPPIAPPPAVPVVPIVAPPPAAPPPVPAGLGELEILLILCALLFLALVLLGIGFSYYCLNKRRHIRVLRPAPSTAIADDALSNKASDTTWAAFDGLRIPRAHAASVSGSEANLVVLDDDDDESSLPSDYPSESPSSAPSVVMAPPIRAPPSELSSVYSDAHFAMEQELVAAPRVAKPLAFDVAVRIKKAPRVPGPPSTVTSADDRTSVMSDAERSLTTILEGDDDDEVIPTIELPRVRRKQEQQFVRSAPSLGGSSSAERTVSEMAVAPEVTTTTTALVHRQELPPPAPVSTQVVVDDRYVSNITETDVFEDVTRHTREVTELLRRPPPPPPRDWDIVIRNYPAPRPGRTTTTTSRASSSDDAASSVVTATTDHQQLLHADHELMVDADDVARMRSRRTTASTTADSRGFNELTTAHHETTRTVMLQDEREQQVTRRSEHHLTELQVPLQSEQRAPNWDVLIRVLSPVPLAQRATSMDDTASVRTGTTATSTQGEPSDEEIHQERTLRRLLSKEDKEKLRQIITTESTLRTLLTEATVKEDFDKIRHDQRYMKLFEPHKWDVIIRVLSPPEEPEGAGGGRRQSSASSASSLLSNANTSATQASTFGGNNNDTTLMRPRQAPLRDPFGYDDVDDAHHHHHSSATMRRRMSYEAYDNEGMVMLHDEDEEPIRPTTISSGALPRLGAANRIRSPGVAATAAVAGQLMRGVSRQSSKGDVRSVTEEMVNDHHRMMRATDSQSETTSGVGPAMSSSRSGRHVARSMAERSTSEYTELAQRREFYVVDDTDGASSKSRALPSDFEDDVEEEEGDDEEENNSSWDDHHHHHHHQQHQQQQRNGHHHRQHRQSSYAVMSDDRRQQQQQHVTSMMAASTMATSSSSRHHHHQQWQNQLTEDDDGPEGPLAGLEHRIMAAQQQQRRDGV